MIERLTLFASDPAVAFAGYAALAGGPPADLAIEAANGAPTRGLHIGFRAPSRAAVDARWAAAGAAGFADDGAPGERLQYHHDYYGGFRLDGDGNSAEAVIFTAPGHPVDRIDHVWLRGDVAALRARFADHLAAGSYRVKVDEPELVRLAAPTGSLTIVPGPPETARVRLAFAGGIVVDL